MEMVVFVLNFASGISMLLVIYAAYMMVSNSKGDFAKAFKIILVGHTPSVMIHLLGSLSYFGIEIIPYGKGTAYIALNLSSQIISALSVFIAIYVIKRALYDKIEKFLTQFRKSGESPKERTGNKKTRKGKRNG